MKQSEELEIHREDKDGVTILRPIGDIDLGRAPALRVTLTKIQGSKPERLIIDLSEVPYMDSSGVATLVEAMQVARRYKGKLILCAMQEKVRAIFEIARLEMVFSIKETVEESLED